MSGGLQTETSDSITQEKKQITEPKHAELLFGAPVAGEIKREVSEAVAILWRDYLIRPCLAAIRVGDDPASEVYVRNKVRACEELGLLSELHVLPADLTMKALLSLVSELNYRNEIDGILVQSPLPSGLDFSGVVESIDPAKDVDGLHPVNVGKIALGQRAPAPCTPAGIIRLLDKSGVAMSGALACVVGRSNIVGRPLSQLLLQENATVTVCHSRTRDLAAVTRQADILVAAIGKPGLIRAEHIKPGAVIVDVGTNRTTDEELVRSMFGPEADKRLDTIQRRGYTLVGDVNPFDADRVASMRTPVPGGVGLLTIAMLMRNTVILACTRRGLPNVL
jgi:methylenetetrahydrofolate dehydrogenase (NADP+)/methenyltetrahydrofolate cyclohydrolase